MTVRLTIGGRAVEATKGNDLLSTCLAHGVEIPYFCWHEALGSVGACRLCAVHVMQPDGSARLEMACTTQAVDGQVVDPDHPDALAMRAHVIELLMANHPHDCAVCEAGGACHLQDMTLLSGHRHRRTEGPKRLHRKQDLGPFLTHEMNRCIACYRCTRFYRDFAGGRDFAVFGSQARVWFGRATPGPLESPFAGNLAELCPTGVFNDAAWSAAYARPWDMARTPAVCTRCAVGCNTTLHARDGRLRKAESRFHPSINRHFLCDRGRFGVHAVHATGRATGPTPLDEARRLLANGAVGLGSPNASLEANLALKLFVGADRFHGGQSDAATALDAHILARLGQSAARRATLKDMATADAVVVMAIDLVAEAPIAGLMLRQASSNASRTLAAEKGVPLFLDEAVRTAGEGRKSPFISLAPGPTDLDDVATENHRLSPSAMAGLARDIAAALGGKRASAAARRIAKQLSDASAPVIVATTGPGRADLLDAAAAIAAALGDKAGLALIPGAANSLGLALLHPAGGVETALVTARAGRLPIIALEPNGISLPEDVPLARLDWLANGPGLLLPIAAPEECAGLFVNFEARAQQSHAGLQTALPDAPALLVSLADGPPPDLAALLAELFPVLAGSGQVPAAFSRAAPGFSGRTADDRAGQSAEAVPAAVGAGAAFGWGLENPGLARPDALRADWTGAQLHGPASLYRPALRGAPDSGVAIDLVDSLRGQKPEAAAEPGEDLEPIPALDGFATGQRDFASKPIFDRLNAAPTAPPAPALNPEDAARLGLIAGSRISVNGQPLQGPLVLDPSLTPGCVRLPPWLIMSPHPVRVEAARQ